MKTMQQDLNDLIQLREWVFAQLDKLKIEAKPHRAILRELVSSKEGPHFPEKAFEELDGSPVNQGTLATKVSRINGALIAPACYAHGQHDAHWHLAVTHRGPLVRRRYSTKRFEALADVAKGVKPYTAEAFFRAWLLQQKIDPSLCPKPKRARTGKNTQNAEDFGLFDIALAEFLQGLAQTIASRTPVILFGVSNSPLDLRRISKLADPTEGRVLELQDRAFAVRFEYLDHKRMASSRALEMAYHLLHDAHLTSRSVAGNTGPPSIRLLIRETTSTGNHLTAPEVEELAALNSDILGSLAGEVYLDRALWSTVGKWASATRHPPEHVPGLGAKDSLWARLDGFGHSDKAFNASTIPNSQSLVCRDTQRRELQSTWQQVVADRESKVVEIDGENGSGKRSLVDCFVRDHVRGQDAVYCTLDFTHAAVEYPYRPYIEQFLQVMDLDPQANASQRRSKTARAIDGYEDVTRRQLDDVLAVFEKLRPDDRRAGNIFAPANANTKQQRLHGSLLALAASAMKHLAQKSPLVIVAYDFHRGGVSSKRLFDELCEYATATLRDLPILVIYTTSSLDGDDKKSGMEGRRSLKIAGMKTIKLDELSGPEMKALIENYRSQGIRLSNKRIQAFMDSQARLPGRFVDQVVLAESADHPAQRCNTLLAQFLRPIATNQFPTWHSNTAGASALLSIIGGQAHAIVLTDIALRYLCASDPEIERTKALEKHVEREITKFLDRAVDAGVLAGSGDQGRARGKLFRFPDPADAQAIQRRARVNMDIGMAAKLARAVSRSGAEADAKLWEASAALVSKSSHEHLPFHYWRGAAFASLRMGEFKMAKRQFYRAYWFATKEARSHRDELRLAQHRPNPDTDVIDRLENAMGRAWVDALQAYRCYIHALRLQNLAPSPREHKRFLQFMSQSNVRRRRDRAHFDARLSQWHFADIQGKHDKAYKCIALMRGALDQIDDSGVSQQQQLELAYAAWATAIARGQLAHAMRYFSQMMALGALPRGKHHDGINLSSGHDLALYAPSRQASVAWLTGDFSAVHVFMDLLIDRLSQLKDGEAYRRFWAAAYLLPLAFFGERRDTIPALMEYVNAKECKQLGETAEQVSELLSKMAQVPKIRLTAPLEHLLKAVLADDSGPRGQKHRSVWVCLIAQRWLDLAPPRDLAPLVEMLDRAIQSFRSSGEVFLMAELLRLRAMIHQERGEQEQANQILASAACYARSQGAVTLEIRVIHDQLRRKPNREEAAAFAERLRWLTDQCDFPRNHHVEIELRETLKRLNRRLGHEPPAA